MTAASALSSVSCIAVATAIGQVIPFPAPTARADVADDVSPVAAIEIVPAAENDNVPAVAEEFAAPAVFSSKNATFERAALSRAVDLVATVVEKRNTIPILSNLRMAEADGRMEVVGTDLDIEISVAVAASVDPGFATTLPADLLKKLLKGAKACQYVTIDTGEHKDSLDFERATYTLESLPVADYPDLKRPGEKASTFTLPGAAFVGALQALSVAVSTEETRYYLNGIFMHAHLSGNEYSLNMVATDGHRLHLQQLDLPHGAEGMAGIIVPRKTVETLIKLLKGKNCPETVTVVSEESRLSFSYDDVTVISKTIDGTFPDYHRVVPCSNSRFVTINAADMLDAISAVTLLSTERGRAVKLEISRGECVLTVNSPDTGRATAKVACSYDGEEFEVGYNANYLSASIEDALAGGKEFTLNIEDHASPAVITGGRERFKAVLMPMRV